MTSTNQQQEQSLAVSKTIAYGNDVESAILQLVGQRGSCTFDELLHTLADFTFCQVFFAVDRLSREGKVILRHPGRFGYLVSALMSGTYNRLRPQGNRQV
jgi:hypothetical protein